MIYKIISPFVTNIDGDNFKEAIKNFVKINYNATINQMILQDQMNHYKVKLKYYKENNKNKVGITAYPYNYNNVYLQQPIITAPGIISTNNVYLQQPIITNPIITAPGMISTNQNGAVIPIQIPIRYYN